MSEFSASQLNQLEQIVLHIYKTAYIDKPVKALKLQTIIARWPKNIPMKYLKEIIGHMKKRGRIGEEENSVYRLLI